jgi:(p)ppGpp synthase/HD superfamily hydrolase
MIRRKVMLDKAIQLACKVHHGQKDLAGTPYILHPLRVMMKMDTELEMIVAVLHDVIEDGGIELLLKSDFSTTIVGNIFILSRAGGEPYEDYIKKLSKHELARKVKFADLDDNLNAKRTTLLDPVKNAKRREKYLWAKGYLLSIEGK